MPASRARLPADARPGLSLPRLRPPLRALRRDHPVFRQRRFFEGRPIVPDGRKDLAWFAPSGEEMTADHWHDESLRTVGMFFAGDGIRTRGPRGERTTDDSFLLWLHAGPDDLEVKLPGEPWAYGYVVVLSTADGAHGDGYDARSSVILPGRSCLLLRAVPATGSAPPRS